MSFLIDKFRGRKKPPVVLNRTQATAARPMRNPALAHHINDEGYVVVTLPRREDTTGKLLSWVFMVPESRPIVLDEIGTLIWGLCDGKHSFADLSAALAEKYSITAREAEVSLAEFLRSLGKRGMIAFALPKDVAATLTDEQRKVLGVVEVDADAPPPQRKKRRRRGDDDAAEDSDAADQ